MQLEQSPAKSSGHGGYRPGAGRKPGFAGRNKTVTQWASRVGGIKKRLLDHGLGKVDMGPSQVKALEVLLDRHEPRLSSVEVTEPDPRDNADPMALYSQMIAALAANPALLDRLIAAVHAHRASSTAAIVDATAQQSGK